MQSVPITTKVVSLNPAYGEVYSIQHNVINFVRLAAGRWFSTDTQASSNNNTDCHDITEILLKVLLNTIMLTLNRLTATKPKKCLNIESGGYNVTN